MKIANLISSSIFQIISLIFVVFYLLGILNVYFSDKNDYCVMTYMYEYPQYVKISVPENKIYPQYSLHAYSEGRYTENARKMWFDGVPVLFLPGNSGSHKQARSLASVALRKAISSYMYEQRFDFFTMSSNEELSGLYGGVLQHQTEFASACISRILSLYKVHKSKKTVPSSVILVGHSMGGLIAKRLLAYPSTLNTTRIAITLAAPLAAPVVNFDAAINEYYMRMDFEWESYVNNNHEIKDKKLLLSIGGGPRDILMPSGLTFSNDSYINALTTAIPGVWVSSTHVSIVWCKQLVMTITKFLFDIVDLRAEQITEDRQLIMAKARQYFQANRSMALDPTINRPVVNMLADAFWYEDNRRIYQISRPQIDKTTYLMIRLVSFPQNRFVAIESINVEDKDWLFGCAAKFTHNTHRYCKQATSISELGRWTGAATDFGKRKLATIHLHKIIEDQPEWTHVVVKVSPTRKPIVLNVDINDHASRAITVDLPSDFNFGTYIVKQETEPNSIYYEVILPGFDKIHQAFLLYVEPTASCKASRYHVSAEVHVPWAENHEYYHYFTHLKRSPMKLRLHKSNPNVTYGLEATEHVKITLLLDPQCTFQISISQSWYHRLAQLVRNYSPLLFPYAVAIVLLAARANILSLQSSGTCISIHGALMSEQVKPYYSLVFARFASMVVMSVPLLSVLAANASGHNFEVQYFTRSLLVLPAYMTALGILNVATAAILAVMVFSSQLAHRLLFRIMWRGGGGLAEKVASGLQKVPMVVSAGLVCAAPLSCGAASLAAGAAFYAFMLSKMYEEYLEDYVYKLMAKVASYFCRMFWSKRKNKNESETVETIALKPDLETIDGANTPAIEDSTLADKVEKDIAMANEKEIDTKDNGSNENEVQETSETALIAKNDEKESETKCDNSTKNNTKDNVDDDYNNLNFHMMMFFLWLSVTLVNIPALQTWARNFKYSMVLQPDTSYYTGLVMSVCSACVWQMNGPRRNLRYYDAVSTLLFAMAVSILVLGPTSLIFVNYGVTIVFAVITLQQLFDKEVKSDDTEEQSSDDVLNENATTSSGNIHSENVPSGSSTDEPKDSRENTSQETSGDSNSNAQKSEDGNNADNCVCNENRIYSVFKNLRDKFSFTEDL